MEDSLRIILEEKIGKQTLHLSLKDLVNYSDEQEQEGSVISESAGIMPYVFISIPVDLANEIGPLIILYASIKQQGQ